MGSPAEIRYGAKADVEEIASLVNSAYRGESSKCGWTTEADHLGGQRTDTGEISKLIESAGSHFLLCIEAGSLVGVILCQKGDRRGKIGKNRV